MKLTGVRLAIAAGAVVAALPFAAISLWRFGLWMGVPADIMPVVVGGWCLISAVGLLFAVVILGDGLMKAARERANVIQPPAGQWPWPVK